MGHPWFPTRKASKLTFVCFQLQLSNTMQGLKSWSWKQKNFSFEAFQVGNTFYRSLFTITAKTINFWYIFQFEHVYDVLISHILCTYLRLLKICDLEIPQLRLPWYSTAATFIRGGAINLKRRPASNWGWVDPDRIEHIGDCHIKSFNGLRGWTTVRAAAPSMALLPSLLVFDSCLEILLLILLIFPDFLIQ